MRRKGGKEPKETVSIRIDKEIKMELQNIAETRYTSVSRLLSELVKQHYPDFLKTLKREKELA